MRSSELFRRLTKASTPTALRQCVVRPRYRCLHSSQGLQQRKPPSLKRSDDNDPSKAYTHHLIPQNQLSIRHAKPVGKYEAKSTKGLKMYSKEELTALKDKYTPAQMAAVMAGEESISKQDIADQGVLYSSPMALDYLDDFSQLRPSVDKNPEAPSLLDPKTGRMPRFRWKEEDEMVDDLEDWLDEQPADGGNILNWNKFLKEYKVYDSNVNLEDARSYVAPRLFPMDDPISKAAVRHSRAKQGNEEMQEEFVALAKQTGFSTEEIERFQIKFLVTRYVSNQTRLGKRPQVYFMCIAGNGGGMLGVGEAKSQLPYEAKKKAILNAIRNLTPIPRYENRTIYGTLKGKSGGTELELSARHPGFGSRGQFLIWEMCRAAGIKDISAKVTRSRNPMNVVKATFNALVSQPDPEQVALGRGRRMVDLRKVYYAGANA